MTIIRKPISVTVNGIEVRATLPKPSSKYMLIHKAGFGFTYGRWNGKRLTRAAELNEAEVTALERALRKAKP